MHQWGWWDWVQGVLWTSLSHGVIRSLWTLMLRMFHEVVVARVILYAVCMLGQQAEGGWHQQTGTHPKGPWHCFGGAGLSHGGTREENIVQKAYRPGKCLPSLLWSAGQPQDHIQSKTLSIKKHHRAPCWPIKLYNSSLWATVSHMTDPGPWTS